MATRRLSQFFALMLAAFTYWVVVSRPGVVDPQFAGTMYAGFFLLLALVFGLAFIALKLGAGGSSIYWSTETGVVQIRRVGLMIGAMLFLQLGLARVLDLLGLLDPLSSTALNLLIWTMVPAAFLQVGLVKWPARLRYASKIKLFLVGGVGIGLAAAYCFAVVSLAAVEPMNSTIGEWTIRLGSVVVAATAEEVVFRVLLITALLALSASRLQAVFLSSVAFGLMHAPGHLGLPILEANWAMLQVAAFEYALALLFQIAAGAFLGVLWLRTGSITLIALTHAMLNVGTTLVYGL